jgi:dihydrofolate reductase|nr:MAG TPA: Dihydrofolate reductase [Caudoviricetes sp.]
MINMIVCKNNFDYIGKDNKTLYHIPKDLAFFKRKTVNHIIIMGRKTFESLPGMLPNREHWVITRDQSFNKARSFNSIDDVLEAIDPNVDYYIIGGGEIYKQFMPYADCLYITEVDDFKVGDVRFPPINMTKWSLSVSRTDIDEKSNLTLRFKKYLRKG